MCVCLSVCVCVCVYLQVCELVHFLIENCSDVMGSEVVSLLQSYRQKTSSEHGSGEDPPILKLPTRPLSELHTLPRDWMTTINKAGE